MHGTVKNCHWEGDTDRVQDHEKFPYWEVSRYWEMPVKEGFSVLALIEDVNYLLLRIINDIIL